MKNKEKFLKSIVFLRKKQKSYKFYPLRDLFKQVFNWDLPLINDESRFF
jgi:hypothetical protein